MRTPSLALLGPATLVVVLLGACASAGDDGPPAEPAVSADLEPTAPEVAPDAEESELPLMARPPSDPSAFGGHVTPTEIEVPGGLPTAEGDGVLIFEPFGPAPGTSPEQFAAWTGLVTARFLGDPTPEELVELDRRLEELSVIDATPVFINSLLGLDMADPDDIVRAGAITEWWYVAQIRYKQVVLDANPAALLPIHVRNRMLVVDGWVRMWKRTLKSDDGVARLRARVEQLIRDRKAARDKQQWDYEEKLRLRAEEIARKAAEDAEEATGDEPG